MEEITNVQSAIEAGMKICTGKEIFLTQNGSHFLVPDGFRLDMVTNKKVNPDRATGFRQFTSAKSFCNYVNKHKVEKQTVITADEKGIIEAIFNDNAEKDGGAQWGDFGTYLSLEKSRQWMTWCRLCEGDKMHSQEDFAHLIEDNREDLMCGSVKDADENEICNINPAEFSKMILDLEVSVNETLKSKIDPVSGARSYAYSNDDGDSNFTMPRVLVLAIPVYKNGDLLQIILNMRSRTDGGNARFGFSISMKDERIESAFSMVCDRIFEGQGVVDGNPIPYEGTKIEVYRGPVSR